MEPLSIVLLSLSISLMVSAIMCARLEKRLIKDYILDCMKATKTLFDAVDKIANALKNACKEEE